LEGGKECLLSGLSPSIHLDKKTKKWNTRRQCDVIQEDVLCPPLCWERFYLRMLLTTVKGPESWEHLRTFNGEIHPITKRPVWLTVYWRMMGSGNSVCKRLATC